jgi:hypothetical protein
MQKSTDLSFRLPEQFLLEYHPEEKTCRWYGLVDPADCQAGYTQAWLPGLLQVEGLGELAPFMEYYTLIEGPSGEPLPATIEVLNTGVQKSDGFIPLLVRPLISERNWLKRRQMLLGRLSGRGWHYIANIATAGLGYLAYMKLLKHPEDPSDLQNVLAGVDKSFRRVQASSRLLCALAREYEAAREMNFWELCRCVAAFIEGAFLPDFVVTVEVDEDYSGPLVKEISVTHLLVELLCAARECSCRTLKFRSTGGQTIELLADRNLTFDHSVGFQIARQLGRVHGVEVQQVGPSVIRLEIAGRLGLAATPQY